MCLPIDLWNDHCGPNSKQETRSQKWPEIVRLGKIIAQVETIDKKRTALQQIWDITHRATERGNDSALKDIQVHIVPVLLKHLQKESLTPENLCLSIQILTKIVPENTKMFAESLKTLLYYKGDWRIQSEAAMALFYLPKYIGKDEKIEKSLADRLLNDPNPRVRRSCAFSLESWVTPCRDILKSNQPGIQALFSASIKDKDIDTRLLAGDSLKFKGLKLLWIKKIQG